jgi:transcriptional regulator with GAF, ATPase, and Fis domain/tetratricopeptide (TPR) repeat protein
MTRDAVAAITKKPPLRVDYILQKFEQEGFLHSIIAEGRKEFAFTDETTREHMYLKYDTNTRAETHERIAGVIEKDAAGSEKKRLSALAHHYSHSFEHKKAIAYLIDAAREAASRGDHQMAEEFARTGLDKITVAKKYENMIPALTLIRADALARSRRATEAVPLYEKLVANREAMAEMELPIKSGLSRSYLECRRTAEALQQAARALELCRPGTRAFVEASLLTAKAHVAAGTFPAAAARLSELLRTLPDEDDFFCETAVLYARALFWTGDWERALVWLKKGLDAPTIWTFPLVRAHAFLVLSLIDIQKSRADTAEPRIKDAMRIAAQEADDELLLQAQLTLARCMFATDRLDEALRTAKGAAARADELAIRQLAELCRLLVADVLSAKESPDMAIETASQAMSFFLKADSAAGIGLAHLSLGQACVRNANTSRAVVHLKKAERCFESAQMPWIASEVLLWHAKAHSAGGESGTIAESLAKCRAIATAFGQQAILLKADFVHATLDMKQQHIPSAVKRLSGTMERARALGLRVLAAECTCALARIAIESPEHIANPQDVSRKLDAVIETLNTVSVEIAAKRAGLLKRELQARLAPSEKRGQDNTFSDQLYVLSGQAKGRLNRIAFEVELGMTNQSDLPAIRQEIDQKIAVIKSELDERLTDLADGNLKLEAQNKCLVEETNRLRAIQDIIRAMNSTLDEEALINLIMDVAIRQVNAERGFLLLKDDNDNLLFRAARNIEKESIDKPEFKVSMSIARRTINSGEPIVTANAQLDERFLDKSSVLDLRLKSVLCVPLKAKDQIMGAVYVDNRFSAGIFSERELDFLVTFAHHACVAIRNARLYEDLKKQEGRLETMNAMLSQKLNKTGAELDQIKESLRKEQQRTLSQPYYCGIVSRSPQMEKVFSLIDRIAHTSAPVFLLGESGTGKELIAKAIHLKSPRKDKTFVVQNCGAVPPSLLESELFGHTRGSFTGADRDRIGVFELADGGTLFLDEIGDMSLEMQTSILRVVQDGQFRRIGGKDVIKVDVRIVCATNHDMQKLLKDGRFREDLWYRLSVVTVNIPPLRDRKEDIPILVEHFLQKAIQITGGKRRTVSKQAMARLVEYNWPGNVRQLENEIYRATAMAESNIDEAMVLTQATKGSPGEAAEPEIDITNMKQLLKKMQRQLLDKALQKAGGNKAEAARLLGISRQGLLKMLDRHGVEDAAEDELA